MPVPVDGERYVLAVDAAAGHLENRYYPCGGAFCVTGGGCAISSFAEERAGLEEGVRLSGMRTEDLMEFYEACNPPHANPRESRAY